MSQIYAFRDLLAVRHVLKAQSICQYFMTNPSTINVNSKYIPRSILTT